ncbi:S9 family peptidase [Caulobacter mirabilis]|uniref:Peptidase S9 prolyl oligopeptidase catalytic domain-containing protein n=1 Tax=Caulobacter mirabilis TaxID=69666 RepID=A0A2D2AZ93_9CAUL|nr:S9 family peptidase [Caulobacter mirabilis]ATQ43336.1 hypothetical protein CSW64_13380 [Caulobacter mirabilis]
MKPLRLAVLAASLFTCAAQAAPRTMTAVDLLELEKVSAPQVSPDGRTVLYSLGRADWKANEVREDIWRIGIDGRAPQRMVEGPASGVQWAPDGRAFAFVAKRRDDARRQIYVSAIDGGEPRRVGLRRTTPSALRWSPDGRSLYFLADVPDPKPLAKRLKDRDDMLPFETPRARRHLWRMTVADGKTERVTRGEFDVEAFDLSADGRSLLYRRSPSKLNDDNPKAELWLKGGEGADRRLTDNDYMEGGARLSPDGRSLLFLATAENGRYATVNPNLFVMTLADGAVREIAPGLGYELEAAEWSADGREIYISATTGVRRELFAVDVRTEALRPLARGDHSADDMSLSRDGRTLVYLQASATAPAEIYRLDPARPAPTAITQVHAGLAERFRLPRQEAIRWTAPDGQALEGLVTYPLDYQPGRRYPLVVQSHGGPRSSDVFNIFGYGRFNPVLAAEGVMTLSVNYRGGTGYGDAFLQGMNGGYFRHADKDVLSGVDHLVAQGLANPDRLGVMGWSAGGHITNRLVTVTNRFKAAASGAGAVDWPSMYLTSDTRWQRVEWFETPPYGSTARRDLYVDNSPLSALDRVKTPVLILAGERDERVPASQSIMLYRSLKALGVETELYLAPREPHNFTELRHRLFQINVTMGWFAERVLGRPYAWSRAPARAGDEDDRDDDVSTAQTEEAVQ